ncbi:MAG: type 2 isopentenyl-diphosphate Delta-isomerase [Bacteroidia bacterium]|nr:type 2 isopentenyl-diphosphate Delta-isomerase [Bacteroidia bacterium]
MPPPFLEQEQTSKRKQDHIELAFLSQTTERDERFYYEPFLAGHPERNVIPEKHLAGKTLRLPIWIGSMTGGTEKAGLINRNLAQACKEFGMGFGLGSCRIILKNDDFFEDFNVRPIIGDEQVFFANLGIAQIEEIIESGRFELIRDLITRLDADGLIIHINPLQEWLQPEGDKIKHNPIETISRVLDAIDIKIIVKEVGQGFGPKSFMELMRLPIEAIEFGAHGGTNFATLELHRQKDTIREQMLPLTHIGHSAEEMVSFANNALAVLGAEAHCKNIIASGGVRNFLDGYYLIKKSNLNTVYAQASAFLKHATGDYEQLRQYCISQEKGLMTSYQYLSIK